MAIHFDGHVIQKDEGIPGHVHFHRAVSGKRDFKKRVIVTDILGIDSPVIVCVELEISWNASHVKTIGGKGRGLVLQVASPRVQGQHFVVIIDEPVTERIDPGYQFPQHTAA